MHPSSLTIKQLEFPYSIPDKNIEGVTYDAEFFVDGESLAKRFRITEARPWLGRTRFLGTEKSIVCFVRELLGYAEPSNQFGSKRLVLYGCHCGSDFCGVISCQVVKEQTRIHWLDIREEADDDGEEGEIMTSVRVEKISFDFGQYREAVANYLEFLKSLTSVT
jgi:hypothetical protein